MVVIASLQAGTTPKKNRLASWVEKEDTFLWLDSNNFKDKHTHIDALLAIGVEKECESNLPNAINTFETFNKEKIAIMFYTLQLLYFLKATKKL